MGERIDLEADDVADLVGEAPIARQRELPHQVRLQAVAAPHSCTKPVLMPLALFISGVVHRVTSLGGPKSVICTTVSMFPAPSECCCVAG